MSAKNKSHDLRVMIGIILTTVIFSISFFGRVFGENLKADIGVGVNIGGGGFGLDISTDGFDLNIGGGGSATQPGCSGSNCLTAPDPGVYSGIVAATSIRDAIIKWTNFFLGFLALISMVALIYAGFMYITATGNNEQAEKAKKTIQWVVIGIIVILVAYALVNTLIDKGPEGRDY